MKRIIPFSGKVLSFLMLAAYAAGPAFALPAVSITQHPAATVSVCEGGGTSFSVVATGSGALTYQWQVSTDGGASWNAATGAHYSGTASASLTLGAVPFSFHNNQYRCIISDGTPLTSNAGVLTVNAAPIVQTGNIGVNMCATGGTNLTAPVYANLTYQWYVSANNGISFSAVNNGASYSGASTSSLDISNASTFDGYIYRYIATNSITNCAATSGNDTLHVLFTNITSTPAATIPACAGSTTTLPVAANGNGTLSYQWVATPGGAVSNGGIYTGATTGSLGITPAAAGVVRYTVTVLNNGGCPEVRGPFTVQTRPATAVTAQPQPATTCASAPASTILTVSAAGSTLTYQWQTDNGTGGTSWSNTGTSSTSLNLGSVPIGLNGYRYRVNISGACGSALSNEVTVTVRRHGTWLGAVDTNWHVAGNWCGGVPTSTTDVLIPNWAPRMPTISDNTGVAYSQGLTIENTARLTINGGSTAMSGPFDIQGTVAYTALANQPILPANHGSLEVNGSGNKYMQSAVGVSHQLVLAGEAKLVTQSNILSMRAGSDPIVCSPFSDAATSWIVTGNGTAGAANTGLGGLRYEQVNAGSGALLYPIGPTSASYNPIRLTNTGATDDLTIAVNDQQIPGGMYASGIDRTWQVSEATPGGSNVALEVSWEQAVEQQSFNRSASAIIRSDGSAIVQQTNRAAPSGTNPFIRGDGNFTALTLFSVASNAILLPVQQSPVTRDISTHKGYVFILKPSVTSQSALMAVVVPQRTSITCSLADITGRRLWQQTLLFEKGSHSWPMPVERLGKGAYFIQVRDDRGHTKVLTLIKQ